MEAQRKEKIQVLTPEQLASLNQAKVRREYTLRCLW
jgi:hypothetical protein